MQDNYIGKFNICLHYTSIGLIIVLKTMDGKELGTVKVEDTSKLLKYLKEGENHQTR